MNSTKPRYKILFLCTGNSARSIFGEYFAKRLGADRLEAYSAGSNPSETVNPYALKILEENFSIDASDARSKSWDEFVEAGVEFDFVITVCDSAQESCPVWPGQPVIAHWGSVDPAAFEGSGEEKEKLFFQVAMQIHRRVELLCNLPIGKLDHLRLETMVSEIGKMEDLGW